MLIPFRENTKTSSSRKLLKCWQVNLSFRYQKSHQKTHSAKEIGELFGISANKVGRLANLHGLKVSEYGEYYRSKSEYSNKEVDTWVYYDSVIPVLAQLLGRTTA